MTDKQKPQPGTAGGEGVGGLHGNLLNLRERAKALLKEHGLPLRCLGTVLEVDKLASFETIPDDLLWACGLPSRSSPAGGALAAFI